MPRSNALVQAGGPPPSSRLTPRLGRVVKTYPLSCKARVLLDTGEQRVLDFVPVSLSAWPFVRPNSRVIIDYVRGEPWNPYVVAPLDPGVRELSLLTKRPYYEEGLDLTNAVVWEWVHELGGEHAKDLERFYPSLVSWMRMTRDGHLLFKHLQQLPDPNDRQPHSPLYHKRYWSFDLGKDNALTLSWPFAQNQKERRLRQSVSADGTYHWSLQTAPAPERAVTVDVKESGDLALESGRLKVGYANDRLHVENGTASLVLDQDALTLAVEGLTISYANGILQLVPQGEVRIEATKTTIKSAEVVLDSRSIKMAKMNRLVAYKGGLVAAHRHTVSVDGHQHTTSSVSTKIAEGATEVRI